MFLKSVKARGFKSFARPVEFGFEPGITVVVGPNGSGKSNIADAVVWAMGEQSPSAVRGASMQDVIFSGSDKMAPAGMAEVEILLDNSKGVLPIEFSEVLVSRRLYRDGEGSYFINRSACRLIDVAELLSDAGLGRDGHSIISQGKVDSILESKPYQRRSHIEEAAGLGKFKKRRHRAERKLEAVRRNLVRLADIEDELKTNLRPLRRQATAAERSSKLDLQLAVARTKLIKGKLAELTAELQDAESASRDAGSRRQELEAELASTAEERRATEELLSASLQQHKQLAARFYSLKSQQENLVHRRESVTERRETLVQAAGRARAKMDNFRGQMERVRVELERAETEHREDAARLALIEEELSARAAELSAIEEEINRRRQATEEKSRKVGELTALRDRFSHQIEYLGQRKQKLAGAMEGAISENEGHRRELAGLEQQVDAEEAKMAERRETTAAAEAELMELNARRAELDSSRQEIVSRLRSVGEDLRIAKARLTFLGDADRDRSGLPAAAKKIAEEHSVKALVEMIDVEPGYEQAVSAVLGRILFALTARDLGHAGDLLKAAREAELGSVEFLLPHDAGTAEPRREGVDYLIDHVNITGGESSRIADLLAGVRVVEDTGDLNDTANGSTWVTRDGVVYHAGQKLLSFKADPPSSVVLKHRNERRHLEEEREAAETHHRELEQKTEQLDSGLAELDARRAAAENSLREVSARMREAESELSGIQRKRQVLGQEVELKESAHERLLAEDSKLDEELYEANTRLAETESALSEAGVSGDGFEGADDETLVASRLELSKKVTELQISAARVRERERVAGMTIERFRPQLERLEQDLAANTFQLGACGLLEPVAGRLLSIMDQIEAVYGESAIGVEQTLREGEEESERQSAGLRELSQAEAQLQQQLSHASDASTEREVSVTRLRDQVEDQSARLKGLNEKFPDAGLEDEEAAPAEELDIYAEQIERLVRRREQIGPVNPLAQQEYEEMLERQKFMEEQRTDLEQSLDELSGLIKELTDRIETTFSATFEAVKRHFSDVVSTLFPGGEGRLTMVDPPTAADGMEDDDSAGGSGLSEEEADELAAATSADRRGIEISVKPARKAVRSLSLLSGGERSLVAIAFLFAIFLARPAPFYILDEVEAALDDLNIDRLLTMLRRYQNRTQFIVITHQKRTMEVADVLYGVSMGADGTSKVLSRKMPADTAVAGQPEETSEAAGDDAPEDSDADAAGITHDEAEPAALAG